MGGRFSTGLPIGALVLCLVPAWVNATELKSADPQPELEIRIVFDNTSARKDLLRSWGFSAVVDFGGHRVLFDAGSDPILLLEHLEKLQIDPTTIEHAVISHQHGDHLRGVYWVFEKNPKMTVHFLDCFPDEAFIRAAAIKMEPRRVKGPFEVVPGIHSTGVVDGLPPEQSLAIETSQGLGDDRRMLASWPCQTGRDGPEAAAEGLDSSAAGRLSHAEKESRGD